ncbi:MAG: DUF402 domain-containing protein [Roseiflexaceae bacterium]
MNLLEYQYRRRYLDGETGISIMSGIARARHSDSDAWVFDYLLAEPRFTTPVTGRRGTNVVTFARPLSVAARLWLWPDRPLRILHYFDAAGTATLYRVDFATCPFQQDHAIYQTDLYLDLFATPDERDYAILDEDELAVAHERGLITEQLSSAILAQADWLIELLEDRRLGAWLARWCDAPFDLAALGEKPSWMHHAYAPGEPDGWPKE